MPSICSGTVPHWSWFLQCLKTHSSQLCSYDGRWEVQNHIMLKCRLYTAVRSNLIGHIKQLPDASDEVRISHMRGNEYLKHLASLIHRIRLHHRPQTTQSTTVLHLQEQDRKTDIVLAIWYPLQNANTNVMLTPGSMRHTQSTRVETQYYKSVKVNLVLWQEFQEQKRTSIKEIKNRIKAIPFPQSPPQSSSTPTQNTITQMQPVITMLDRSRSPSPEASG